jgi:hypothetical protein
MNARCWPFLSIALLGCLGPEDVSSKVVDLRVLGMAVEPPEIMSPVCDDSLAAGVPWAAFVEVKALLADPKGQGRTLSYELYACAQLTDRTCAKDADRLYLAQGTTTDDEVAVRIQPGAAVLPSGQSLLSRVLELDTFGGLGGIRLPLVLRVFAQEEEIYAQKLMVYSCRFFPEMKANLTPRLPGLLLNGEPWAEDALPTLKGRREQKISTEEFAGLQEPYVVPSFDLQPVFLEESWKISWHADAGLLSAEETGGVDFGGTPGRHQLTWKPSKLDLFARTVTLWAVVRDGRGGTSWLLRRFRFQP